ncbi:MAG: hypothetical protein AMXMBFR84_05050 [Candidatus Hydrogenedentota bacterium]
MPKYGKKAQEKVGKTMREFKHGTLRSSTGKKVTNRKQAIAIGLSEAREAGAKVPKKPPARPKNPSGNQQLQQKKAGKTPRSSRPR